MNFRVQPLTYGQIKALARPADPNQPEAIPAVLYDTQTLVQAGVAALAFFQANTIQDETITNVLGGRLPEGFNFRVQAFGCDMLRRPTAGNGTVVGVLDDIALILKTNRATFQFKKSDKEYGRIPLSFAHSSGGETGGITGSLTAPANMQFGNSGVFSGGFSTDGSIIIETNETFKVTLNFAQPFTAIAVDTPLRFWMRGTLYRPVR